MIKHFYPWQATQWQHYQAARQSQHLSHALLIVGDKGIGKHDFADLLAQSLLCEQVDQQCFACGVCQSCKVHRSNAHPDFQRITLAAKKTQITVDAIRQLIAFLALSRSYQGQRVVIIEQAEKMNINAANSLLKALEEPAANTVIILVVNQLSKILPTIKSRCQCLHMQNPSAQQATDWLTQQKLQSAPDVLLNLADNKPLLALQFDQMPELLQQRKQLATYLVEILQNTQSITVVAKKLEKLDLDQSLNWQLKWVQQLIKQLALDADEDAVLQTKHPVLITMYRIMVQAGSSSESLWELYQQLMELKAMTDYPLNRIIFIESMLLSWRAFAFPNK